MFVISKIIKVEVRVISLSLWLWLWLITLTETLIIPDITKTKSNNCLLCTEQKKKRKSCFCFFTDGKKHKALEPDMITCDLECPRHDYCIVCSYDVMGADFKNSLNTFGQSENR